MIHEVVLHHFKSEHEMDTWGEILGSCRSLTFAGLL